MNLVVGATGLVGGEICRLLAEAGKPVRALVRASSDPAKVRKLEELGATIVRGDLRDRASLQAACRGAVHVLATAACIPMAYVPEQNTPATDRDGYFALIDSAREAGVRQFVYTSFAAMDGVFPLQDTKRAVEAHLRKSGLVYTILRPTCFMEVWLGPHVVLDYPNRKARIQGPGENPISWISAFDVARFAVASLDNPRAENLTIDLGGPEALSQLAVVKIFETVGGKPFDVTHVPLETLRSALASATDPMMQSLTALMIASNTVAAIDMKDALAAFPMKLKSVQEYARAVMS
jgi:NADH dehydrogenase